MINNDNATTTSAATFEMTPVSSPRRIKIYFQDDAVRQRAESNARSLLLTAATSVEDTFTSSTPASACRSHSNSLLARKALKYRKVLDRMHGVDVHAPGFNASKFLGVDWCKTTALEAQMSLVQQC